MQLDLSHGGIVRLVAAVTAVAMSLFHLWVIAFGAPEPVFFRGTHLIFAMVLIFLWYRMSGRSEGNPTVLDYVLLVLAVAPVLHLLINYSYIVNRIYYIDDLTLQDMLFGTALVLLVLEATRRMIGWPLPVTALVFLGYGLLHRQDRADAAPRSALYDH